MAGGRRQDEGGAKLGQELVWGGTKEVGGARVGRLKAKARSNPEVRTRASRDSSYKHDCGREQIWGGQDLGKGKGGKGVFVDQRKKRKAESEPEKERVV